MIRRLTSLDRGLDWAYPSNRFVAGLCLAFAVAAFVLQNVWLGQPVLWGVLAGAGWVFTAWALGRELDPDHPETAARAAVALALSQGLLLPLLSAQPRLALAGLLVTGVLVVLARLLGRTTGRPTTWLDVVAVASSPLLATWLSGRPLWALALPLALALVADANRDGAPRRAWAGLALAVGAGVVTLLWVRPTERPASEPWVLWFAAATVLLGWAALLVWMWQKPLSKADDGRPLEYERLLGARALVALATLLLVWTTGFLPLLALGWVGIFGAVAAATAQAWVSGPSETHKP